MDVSQRLKIDYLNSMGLSTWYPRVILNNSQSPIEVDLTFTTPNKIEVSNSLAATQESTKHSASVNAADSSAELVAHQVSAAGYVSTDKVDETHTRTPIIRFGLGLYVFGDYMVVSSLAQNYQSLQDPSFRLLQGILNLLEGKSTDMIHHHVISWPFFTNPNADQGIDQARQYTTSIIEQVITKHSTKRMLIFGGVLPRLNDWNTLEGEWLNTHWLLLPSLYKMLSEPSLKAKAWSIMKKSKFIASS